MTTDNSTPETSDFAPTQTPDPNAQQAPPEEELPEKYRGKTVKEIVDMHANAERELGRARNEVGTVRRLADELLGLNRAHLESRQAQEKPKEREKLTTDALFNDPERAITEVIRQEKQDIESNLERRLAAQERALALGAFEKRHPSYRETMESEDFLGWVQKSPHRLRLAQAAAINEDFLAADELLGLYNEVKAARSEPAEQPRTTSADAARQASLARPGGSNAAGVGSTSTGKKIWSRAELIDMRIRDPEKFDALYETELRQAYAEKRVR